MPAKVVIKKCNRYDVDEIYVKIKDAIDLLGGISSFIKKGDKVLLKPNMLSGYPPEKVVNTHPAVVEAAARLVLEAGGIPKIADSPGFSTAFLAAKKAGYEEVAKRLGIECRVFDSPVKVSHKKGKIYKSFEVDKDIVESDKIINIAKLKTHIQMHLTLTVKNMFGSMVGQEKVLRHLMAGRDYDLFASMLVELCYFTNPCLNILDGIIGMEGDGPGSGGMPRKIGVLVAGRDAVSVDRVACEIIGVDHKRVPIFKASEKLDVGTRDLDKIEIMGETVNDVRIRDFVEPNSLPLDTIVPTPGVVKIHIKNFFSVKPVISHKMCTKCGLCMKLCPVKAISEEKKRILMDYSKCIRCFCCQEHCPEGAIAAKRNAASKIASFCLNKLFSGR